VGISTSDAANVVAAVYCMSCLVASVIVLLSGKFFVGRNTYADYRRRRNSKRT